jgi:hypothetical protein
MPHRPKENPMNVSLQKLVESASKIRMSEPQKAEQRISFAYGTTKIENDNITREMVVEATKKPRG